MKLEAQAPSPKASGGLGGIWAPQLFWFFSRLEKNIRPPSEPASKHKPGAVLQVSLPLYEAGGMGAPQ